MTKFYFTMFSSYEHITCLVHIS